MKLALRRIPFVLMVAIGGSYVLLRTVLPILSLFHVDIEINDNAVIFLYFANLAAFWTALAAAFMIWRKGITRRYLRGNQAQLENVCQQLSAILERHCPENSGSRRSKSVHCISFRRRTHRRTALQGPLRSQSRCLLR